MDPLGNSAKYLNIIRKVKFVSSEFVAQAPG
jgi:hypothetical protein